MSINLSGNAVQVGMRFSLTVQCVIFGDFEENTVTSSGYILDRNIFHSPATMHCGLRIQTWIPCLSSLGKANYTYFTVIIQLYSCFPGRILIFCQNKNHESYQILHTGPSPDCAGEPAAHYSPLWFDVCASAYVVFGGEHKFVVKNPLGFVVQNRRRVQLDHLVVFDCEVMTSTFQVGHLGGEQRGLERSTHGQMLTL